MKFWLCLAVVLYLGNAALAAGVNKNEVAEEEGDNSVQCTLCKDLVHWAYEYIEGDKSKIVNAVEKVCNHIPSTLKAECDKIISTYGDRIIEMLLNSSTAEIICTTIKVCP